MSHGPAVPGGNPALSLRRRRPAPPLSWMRHRGRKGHQVTPGSQGTSRSHTPVPSGYSQLRSVGRAPGRLSLGEAAGDRERLPTLLAPPSQRVSARLPGDGGAETAWQRLDYGHTVSSLDGAQGCGRLSHPRGPLSVWKIGPFSKKDFLNVRLGGGSWALSHGTSERRSRASLWAGTGPRGTDSAARGPPWWVGSLSFIFN